MKKNSLSVCLSVCLFVSGSKVKRTIALQLLKTLLYLLETRIAGAEKVREGGLGESPP
jgi:hypothetical protein